MWIEIKKDFEIRMSSIDYFNFENVSTGYYVNILVRGKLESFYFPEEKEARTLIDKLRYFRDLEVENDPKIAEVHKNARAAWQ